MKQYVKALDQDGECFKYLEKKFLELSSAKIQKDKWVYSKVHSTFFQPLKNKIKKMF